MRRKRAAAPVDAISGTTRASACFDASRDWEADRARSAAGWIAATTHVPKAMAQRRVRLGRVGLLSKLRLRPGVRLGRVRLRPDLRLRPSLRLSRVRLLSELRLLSSLWLSRVRLLSERRLRTRSLRAGLVRVRHVVLGLGWPPPRVRRLAPAATATVESPTSPLPG